MPKLPPTSSPSYIGTGDLNIAPLTKTEARPRLPLELISRIYLAFDPLHHVEHRDILAKSLRVNKQFFTLLTPRLYQQIALRWVHNIDLEWSTNNLSKSNFKLESRDRPSKLRLKPRYSKLIKNLIINPHRHRYRNAPEVSGKLDFSSVELVTIVGGDYGLLVQCDRPQHSVKWRFCSLACLSARPKTIIYDLPVEYPPTLFKLGHAGERLNTAPVMDRVERIVLRPFMTSRVKPIEWFDLSRWLDQMPSHVAVVTLLLGSNDLREWGGLEDDAAQVGPDAVDIISQSVGVQISRMLNDKSDKLRKVDWTLQIVGCGHLGGMNDKSVAYRQERIETSARAQTVARHGDNEQTRAALRRLKFEDLKTFALQLKGIQREIISKKTWERWDGVELMGMQPLVLPEELEEE